MASNRMAGSAICSSEYEKCDTNKEINVFSSQRFMLFKLS